MARNQSTFGFMPMFLYSSLCVRMSWCSGWYFKLFEPFIVFFGGVFQAARFNEGFETSPCSAEYLTVTAQPDQPSW